MTKTVQTISALFFLLVISGCAQLQKHADTIKPTAKLTGTRLANIDFDKVDIIFDLAVKNKNPIELNLAGLDYDLKIENQSLVSGVTAKAVKLKANSTSAVQLPVTLKFDDLKKLPGELWDKDKLAYDLQTTFNIKLPIIGNYAIPVDKQGEVPVPKMPDIKIKDVKVKNLSFTSAEVIAQIEVYNPNDFNLGLNNMDYQLKVNQDNWGHGKINKSINIAKKSKGIIEIPVKLNLLTAGKSAYDILINKSPIDYQLKGNVTINSALELLKDYKMPLDISGTTSLR